MDKKLAIRDLYGLWDSDTLLSTPPEELDDATVVGAWSVLDGLEKTVIKQRKDILREYLFALAEKKGSVNKSGSYVFKVPNSDKAVITKERRRGKVSIIFEKLFARFKNTPLGNKLFKYTVEMTPVQYSLYRELLTLNPADISEHQYFLRDVEGVPSLVSESTLEGLVANGEVSLDDFKEVTEVGASTFALKVTKPLSISKLLNVFKGK